MNIVLFIYLGSPSIMITSKNVAVRSYEELQDYKVLYEEGKTKTTSKVKEGSENSHEAEFVSKRYFAAFFGRHPPRRVSQCICLADPGLSNCSEA